jgi:hypothetical protein
MANTALTQASLDHARERNLATAAAAAPGAPVTNPDLVAALIKLERAKGAVDAAPGPENAIAYNEAANHVVAVWRTL